MIDKKKTKDENRGFVNKSSVHMDDQYWTVGLKERDVRKQHELEEKDIKALIGSESVSLSHILGNLTSTPESFISKQTEEAVNDDEESSSFGFQWKSKKSAVEEVKEPISPEELLKKNPDADKDFFYHLLYKKLAEEIIIHLPTIQTSSVGQILFPVVKKYQSLLYIGSAFRLLSVQLRLSGIEHHNIYQQCSKISNTIKSLRIRLNKFGSFVGIISGIVEYDEQVEEEQKSEEEEEKEQEILKEECEGEKGAKEIEYDDEQSDGSDVSGDEEEYEYDNSDDLLPFQAPNQRVKSYNDAYIEGEDIGMGLSSTSTAAVDEALASIMPSIGKRRGILAVETGEELHALGGREKKKQSSLLDSQPSSNKLTRKERKTRGVQDVDLDDGDLDFLIKLRKTSKDERKKGLKTSSESKPRAAEVQEIDEEDRRAVTKEVFMRGILKRHRKRDVKNPRVANRRKAEKADKRMVGRTRKARGDADHYEGELGIKANVVRARQSYK
ncbi:hypothetical protein ADUPG1_008627 [Aduncisulcus paluster]|uniref:Sas10 C-terminal domain-containing protein n=1 Tax=Aduncisulcus paluster TaxID=2918883 RepID=A0ABQ5KSN7_9EUKA|nr:hypothetical protein ADUPG1_008627 [Aduncisulcus paluster]